MEAMDIRFGYDSPPVTLPADQEAVLAMIVREAVTNVVRHARADRCRIVFRQESEELVMEVRDNGVGGELNEGGGISGMRARLEEIGGTLEIHRGEGWRVVVRIPLTAVAKEVAIEADEQSSPSTANWAATPERPV
jgi:two-component system sensor histidine kinase DesK